MSSDEAQGGVAGRICFACGALMPPAYLPDGRRTSERCPFCGVPDVNGACREVVPGTEREDDIAVSSETASKSMGAEQAVFDAAPFSPDDMINEAVELAKQGQYAAAEASLRGIPEDAARRKVAYGIAYCRYKVGDFGAAMAYAREAAGLGSRRGAMLQERIQRKLAKDEEDYPVFEVTE